MTLEDFLDRLEDVRPGGNGYVACCPAHDDRQASLGVTSDDEKILVNCYAGCSTQSVLEAMELQFRDLYFNSINMAEPEAVYSYTNEDGEELFQAVRFPGKQFRQRHRGEGEEWVWNLDRVRRVLYRLPEVLQAVREGRTVYICEGEKDVETLRVQGKTATCNPMGAGKWRPEYAEWLRGAAVIIVQDRDEPGRQHAETVKQSLLGVAKVIWVMQAKSGKDVTDHFEAGHTLEELLPVRSSVRRGIMTASELAERGREYLDLNVADIPGYVLCPAVPVVFRQGRMYAVGAYTGDGKTSYALQGVRNLCAAGARVGYGSLEMPERDLRNKLVAHSGIPQRLLEEPWRIKADPALNERYWAALEEVGGWNLDIVFDSGLTADKLIEHARDREWDVVFVDHIHRFGWGKERRTLEAEVLKLTNLALEQNVMVVLLCQLRKQTRGRDMEVYPRPTLADFRETSQIADDASIALAIWRQRDEGGLTYTGSTQVVVLKNRHTTGAHDQAGSVIFPHFDMERQMLLSTPERSNA